ncbi:MAG: SDR family NAD(P)-dependent oxidoreductase [Actinomycetota bacterium]|jgi:NAD(P)-dependent dehydrogenase (short-subunit alcohol dehydrogenase family)
MSELRFDGQVAVITGAGRNLGREYALLLASRGAKVVVNDIGVGISDTDGVADAPATNPALDVVAEITAAGGHAVLDTSSITDPQAGMVQTAIDAFGRIDIVINNAGVVRQAPVPELSDEFCRAMTDTHMLGTMNVTRAAWSHMAAQGYGRIVNVSSGAGLIGFPNMTMYGGVKLGVVGLSRALAVEGRSLGINVNVVAPQASVRGSDFGPMKWTPALAEWLSPEQISGLVAYLAHESCVTTGELFNVGGGLIARVVLAAAEGVTERPMSPEAVAAHWDEIMSQPVREAPAGKAIGRKMMQGYQP